MSSRQTPRGLIPLLISSLSRRNVSFDSAPHHPISQRLPARDANHEAVLQDPSVAASSIENKISFLRTKNLTQEEIDAALARAGAVAPRAPYAPAPQGPPQGPPQQYYQPYPQYAWQPPAATPKRDWRDWFIMATVVGGVSYGLFSLGKVQIQQCARLWPHPY